MGEETKTDKDKYEVDEALANGPLSNRGCNDILCCLLFLVNITAFLGIGIYGFSQGHPDRLLVGYDSDGRACGKDTGVTDYKYIYMPSLKTLTRSICVKDCPTMAINYDATTNTDAASGWAQLTYAATPSAVSASVTPYNVPYFVAHGYSATDLTKSVIYQTKGFFGRVCLPYGSQATQIVDTVGNAFGSSAQSIEKYISDLKTGWATILGSAGIAFFVALIYMVVLRYFAGLLTWISIIAYFACIIALAVLLLKKGQDQYDEGVAANDSSEKSDGNNLKYISYAVFAFAGVCGIIFLCLFNKIRQAIAIIKSAALFVAEVKSVFLVPPIISICNMLFIAWWIVTFVYVYSVGDVTGSDNGPFASVTWKKNVRYMLIYHIFSGLWINAFFGAMIQFILATACALWYFNKPNEPHLPVSTGLKRALTNHFGSLAFGALLLALVQFIRLILEYISQQAKKTGADQNRVLKFFINCMRCYAACFERFIRYINKNAYIQIAITGKNFCLAAIDAFKLIWCNPLKFGIIASIGGIFIFIGRVFIAGVTGLICYIIFIKQTYYKEHLFSPILPTVFCIIIGYLIGTFFMSVYGMGVDTILQCTCLDEELMKKTGKDPDRCPGPLKEFFAGQGKK